MLTSTVMIALGAFRFGVSGGHHQELRRQARWRWEKSDRVGRAPAYQYLGPGPQEITLDGVIYPHYRGGLRQVELMRAQAGLGLPLMMVDGLGWVWQRWCITGVDETKSYLMSDGAPLRIQFRVELVSYGEDRA